MVDALGYWIDDTKAPRDLVAGSLGSPLTKMPSEDRLAESSSKGALTAKERSSVLEAINTALAQQQNENMMPGLKRSCVVGSIR